MHFRRKGRRPQNKQVEIYGRFVSHVSTQVAPQRCPILCMSSWIISLLQVVSFSKLKWAHFQYYISVILSSSSLIYDIKNKL
jgi:hypothetical protein